MLQFTPLQTTDKDYSFVENLLHESFPEAERRDDVAQRDNVDNCAAFTCYLISDDELLVGLITVWKFAGFSYVEHLATSPSVRNKGYGRKSWKSFSSNSRESLFWKWRNRWTNGVAGVSVLSAVRILFMRKEYVQPSYREGGETLPMFLMYAGTETIDKEFESIRDEIYRKVYGVESV